MKNITKLIDIGIWGWVMFNLGYSLVKSIPLSDLKEVTGFDYVWWVVFMVSSNYIQSKFDKSHDK